MDTGNGRMPVGIGSATNPGPGLVTIMAIGTSTRLTVGFGSPALNGPRHGSSGARPRITLAGRRVGLEELAWRIPFLCSLTCTTFMIGSDHGSWYLMIHKSMAEAGQSVIFAGKTMILTALV